MKNYLAATLLLCCLSSIAQKSLHINAYLGLNNAEEKIMYQNSLHLENNTSKIYNIGIEYVFQSRIGIKLNFARSMFDVVNHNVTPSEYSETYKLGLNLGWNFHFIASKRINLSSGVHFGYHLIDIYALNGRNHSTTNYWTHCINVVDFKYYLLNNLGVGLNINVGTSLYSNFLVGLTYRLKS